MATDADLAQLDGILPPPVRKVPPGVLRALQSRAAVGTRAVLLDS